MGNTQKTLTDLDVLYAILSVFPENTKWGASDAEIFGGYLPVKSVGSLKGTIDYWRTRSDVEWNPDALMIKRFYNEQKELIGISITDAGMPGDTPAALIYLSDRTIDYNDFNLNGVKCYADPELILIEHDGNGRTVSVYDVGRVYGQGNKLIGRLADIDDPQQFSPLVKTQVLGLLAQKLPSDTFRAAIVDDIRTAIENANNPIISDVDVYTKATYQAVGRPIPKGRLPEAGLN